MPAGTMHDGLGDQTRYQLCSDDNTLAYQRGNNYQLYVAFGRRLVTSAKSFGLEEIANLKEHTRDSKKEGNTL